jgi:hypothetical protein
LQNDTKVSGVAFAKRYDQLLREKLGKGYPSLSAIVIDRLP